MTKLSELKADDVVEVSGLTCTEDGTQRVVQFSAPDVSPYIICDHGAHFLDGQTVGLMDDTDDDTLVGITKVGEA